MSDERKTLIYVKDVEGGLYPSDSLYPSNDLYPNKGTIIIGEYNTDDVPGISSGSLKLDEILMDGSLNFGKCCSNKFEVQLYNIYWDFAKKPITVVQRVDDTETPIFQGIIDSSEKDSSGFYRDIIAYDDYYFKKDLDVATWFNNLFANNPSATYTVKALREGLLTHIGIPFKSKTLINDDILIGNSNLFDSITVDVLLGYLCEFSFCVPHMTRQGVMDFIMLSTKNPISLVDKYENGENSTFEDYVTNNITGIQLYNDGSSVAQAYGSEENAYAIEANIFMLNMSAEQLDTIFAKLLEYIKNIRYTPCTVHMLESNWDILLGDYVETQTGKHYIMENSCSGSLLIEQDFICSATGASLGNKPTNSRSFTAYSGKVSRLEKNIDKLSVEFENQLEGVKSNITQTAEKIETEVTRATTAEDNLNSKITQTAESITAEVTRATKAEDNLSTRIQANAEGITTKVSKNSIISEINQSAESVTIKANKVNLDGYVTVSNLQTPGKTVIDGGNITTGEISCDRLNGGTIKGQTIVGGTINNGNGVFTVDNDGAVSASNINITGGSISLQGDTVTTTKFSISAKTGISNIEISPTTIAMTSGSGERRVFINSVLGNMVIRSAITSTEGYMQAAYGFRVGDVGDAFNADSNGVMAVIFREKGRGYAMCGSATGHTYHCSWDETTLWFQVDDTWVWNSSDKRLKKNIESISDEYIDAVGSVDLIQYNLNRKNYSDKELYFGALAQDVVAELEQRGLTDDGLKLLSKQQVAEDDDTLYYGMDYEQFLILRLAHAEKRIAQLENQVENLIELLSKNNIK